MKSSVVPCLLLLVLVSNATYGSGAAEPRLVKDVNTRQQFLQGSVCGEPVSVNGVAFFCGANRQLWVTDGTARGTRQLRLADGTIVPGLSGSVLGPRLATSAGGLFYFLWSDELWRTDGTPQGTYALVDDQGRAIRPMLMTNVDDFVYFFHLGDLWRTDGTAEGTRRVRAFEAPLFEQEAAAFNGELFFTRAAGNASPAELWKSDGTSSGTRLIKTITAGDAGNLTTVGGTLFFTAGVFTGPVELWKSDGTPAGTVLVKPGIAEQYQGVGGLTDVQGTLYFVASSNYVDQIIWKSDGTPGGTASVVTLPSVQSNPMSASSVGDIYLLSTQLDGLWRTDGTPEGTFKLIERLAQVTPPPTWMHRGLVYFAGDDGSGLGTELWVTDGTRAGTRLVRDIHRGEPSSTPFWMASIDAGLVFEANPGRKFGGPSLWITDGTRHGTRKIKDLGRSTDGSHPSLGTVVGDHLYFLANMGGNVYWRPTWELWRTDGTYAGTEQVLDLIDEPAAPGEFYRNEFAGLQGVDDAVYVSGRDASGWGLWRSTGGAGFEPLRNVVPVRPSTAPSDLTSQDGKLYFFSDTEAALGLWRLDEGADAATLLEDGLVAPSKLGLAASRLVFSSNGDELWWSDGTPAGTRRIASLGLGPDTRLGRFQKFGDRFVFEARWGFNRWGIPRASALWISDGTGAGTVQLRRPYPQDVRVTERGILYAYLYELWLSDGSSAGTVVGRFADSPRNFTQVGDRFYFSVLQTLWLTDGTASGTVQVADGWEYISLAEANDELYFTAFDPLTGGASLRKLDGPGGTLLIEPDLVVVRTMETGGGRFLAGKQDDQLQVWETDGTVAGTRRLTSFGPNPYLQEPWEFLIDGTVLLVADDGIHGLELWAFGPPDPTLQGMLGDYVWLDSNETGVQDEDEPGVAGVLVHLESCTGDTIASTRSDAAGAYAFRGLTAGDYQLRFRAPFAHVFSPPGSGDYRVDSNPDPATGTTACVELASPQRRLAIDAGFILQPRAQVGDRVWHDLDRDGAQDHNEPGFADVSVLLETCDGSSVLQTTSTDGRGAYLFDWLADGDYRVRFVAPGGYTFSPKNATDDFRIDSNADPASGRDSCRTVRAGQQRLALDAGLMQVE